MNKSRNKNQISGTCQKYQSCHSFFSFPAILKKIKKLTISNKIYLILLSGFFLQFPFQQLGVDSNCQILDGWYGLL